MLDDIPDDMPDDMPDDVPNDLPEYMPKICLRYAWDMPNVMTLWYNVDPRDASASKNVTNTHFKGVSNDLLDVKM